MAVVTKDKDGKTMYHLYDQGPATNIFTGHTSFDNEKDFNDALNDYVSDKQEKRTTNGSEFPAVVQVFEIYNEKKVGDAKDGTKKTKGKN